MNGSSGNLIAVDNISGSYDWVLRKSHWCMYDPWLTTVIQICWRREDGLETYRIHCLAAAFPLTLTEKPQSDLPLRCTDLSLFTIPSPFLALSSISLWSSNSTKVLYHNLLSLPSDDCVKKKSYILWSRFLSSDHFHWPIQDARFPLCLHLQFRVMLLFSLFWRPYLAVNNNIQHNGHALII